MAWRVQADHEDASKACNQYKDLLKTQTGKTGLSTIISELEHNKKIFTYKRSHTK